MGRNYSRPDARSCAAVLDVRCGGCWSTRYFALLLWVYRRVSNPGISKGCPPAASEAACQSGSDHVQALRSSAPWSRVITLPCTSLVEFDSTLAQLDQPRRPP